MVYNYTKPRGRIAAMDSSPGPCYALPSLVGHTFHDPRSVHSKGPAYPFGVRHTHAARDLSGPGPCYLPDYKTYRTGRDGVPHFSLQGRTMEPKRDLSPGPAAYYPERCGARVKSAPPSYSFGVRVRDKDKADMPGPNVYNVQSCIGQRCVTARHQAPSFSLSSRTSRGAFDEDLRKTPGPGSYNIVEVSSLKRKPPEFSVTGRVKPPPSDDTRKPGPGKYYPEKVRLHKMESPHFSFGIRHSQYASSMLDRQNYLD